MRILAHQSVLRTVCAFVAAVFVSAFNSWAADWPQWGGASGRNMVSTETNLPESFQPGEKDASGKGVRLETTRNVLWTARLGQQTCSTPVVAGGRVFIGTNHDDQGVLLCLSESTGKRLWQWKGSVRSDLPRSMDGRMFMYYYFPRALGVCSTPAVESDRVYFVNQRCEVVCLDAAGPSWQPSGIFGEESVRPVWSVDLWALGVRPADMCNGSPLVDGDLLYVSTSNGVDRDAKTGSKDELRKIPAPNAPNLVVLEKKTGRLVATDEMPIGPRLLHGQWSSPSLGQVGDRKLLFFGGGDGVCYALEAPASVPETPVKLKTVWSYDCNPTEYKSFAGLDRILHFCLGDKRRIDSLNKANDGSFVGMSQIIATPVFLNNRIYVATGRDPEHGRGRGALHCIDATQRGDITQSGRLWCYQGLDRSLSTVSVAAGLLFVADVSGRVHCLDAETGLCHWVYDGRSRVIGSTLVADGKLYVPTEKSLQVLAAGRELKLLGQIPLGAPIWSSPVAANGVLYVASKNYLWAVRK